MLRRVISDRASMQPDYISHMCIDYSFAVQHSLVFVRHARAIPFSLRVDNNWIRLYWHPSVTFVRFNSSDAGDELFRLWVSVLLLLIPWFLLSADQQQSWYWLCMTENMYHWYREKFIYWVQAKFEIRFMVWMYILKSWNNSKCQE